MDDFANGGNNLTSFGRSYPLRFNGLSNQTVNRANFDCFLRVHPSCSPELALCHRWLCRSGFTWLIWKATGKLFPD